MKDFKYIDIIDLPSDRNGALGKFRTDLIKAYNFNRTSPEKLKLLAATMLVVVEEINKGMETPDSVNVEAFRMHQIDKEIKSTSETKGFEPIVPKPFKAKPRAAKRTSTKSAKRTTTGTK